MTTTTVQRISKSDLLHLLMGVNKSTFVNITMKTSVRMNKTGNPYFNRVEKISSTNFLMGNDYETRVQSNEEKEGLNPDFSSQKPSGIHHVSKCVLQSDKDESVFYVMVERFDEIVPQTEYICDGNSIDKHLFDQWMVKPSPSTKQDQVRKVMVLTPKIENIIGITLDGIRYEVE